MAGAGFLVAGAMAGALWVTLGAGAQPAPTTPTVNVQQAAANSTAAPTTTITVTKAVKPKTAPKKVAVKPQVKVNSVTRQSVQAADPDPSDTSAALPPGNGSGYPGGAPTDPNTGITPPTTPQP